MKLKNLLILMFLPILACACKDEDEQKPDSVTVARVCFCSSKLNRCKVIDTNGKAYIVLGSGLNVGNVVDNDFIITQTTVEICQEGTL